MSEPFSELGDAISDQRFVDVDLALRRGQHIDHDEADWYAYLLDAQAVLEPFYRRYGCELIHRSDGYFFLLPTGDKVAKRLLGVPEMIVGQGAALLYLDPSTIESGGVVSKDDLLSHLAAVMGTDALVSVFNPKRKRVDERVAQETVRQRVGEGLRKLTQLGFVTVSDDNRIRLRSALMRFADPVRGAGSPRDALEKLIARGEVAVLSDATDEGEDERSEGGTPPRDEERPEGVEYLDSIESEDLDGDPLDAEEGDGDADELDDASETDELDDASAAEEMTEDDEPADDEYVFDRDAHDEGDEDDEDEDEDEDVDEDVEPPVGEDLGADFDGSFGMDFDEPPVSKASVPVGPPSPPPPPPKENTEKPSRNRRKTESLHPEAEAEADSAVPGSTEEPKFDEFD
jgi:chromosome partition protein MukE